MRRRGFGSLFAGWFSTVRAAALTALFTVSAFILLQWLGQGAVRELSYALLLIGVGLGAAGIRSFIRFAARQAGLDAALANLPPEEGGLPRAETAPERGFRALADAYRKARNADAGRAAAAEKERLEYFTLWVHQIKTPISALDLMAQSDDPVDRELLRQEVLKISRYADAALSFQRLQSLNEDLALTDVPLYPLCCSVVRELRPIFLYRKISLHMEPFEGVALSDAKWLGMALGQVLTNALTYTPEGGSVTIGLKGPLMLFIGDTGPGIPAEDLPRVFERGFTGSMGRAERSGEKSTGIGLYLCKQACDKLGHRLAVASAPGEGATVTFDLRRERFDSYA
jgi:signal transduction histidine kinase